MAIRDSKVYWLIFPIFTSKLIYMNKAILLIVLVVVSMACSPKEESNLKVSETPSVDSDTNLKPISRFSPASAIDIEKIAQGLKSGISLCDCYQTKSLDFENVFAIACKVKGGEIAVGVWAIGANAGIFSVGYPTATISDWGTNPKMVGLEDEGFQEILDYVRELPLTCGD